MPNPADERENHAAGKPHQESDLDFTKKHAPHIRQLDQPGRQSSNNEGRGLEAHVPTHRGNDRNKTDNGHHFLNRIPELPQNRAGQQTADEIRKQPRKPYLGDDRLEDFDTESSSIAPAILSMSSVASSRITSTTSSTVIMPTNLLSLSMTGIASKL